MMTDPRISPRSRYFPSKFILLAAGELLLIAILLHWSNSPAFSAAAIACSLCAFQLGILLINRFQENTVKVRKAARQAAFSSQAVLITDASGRIKWANSTFTELTGYALPDAAGKTFSMLLHGQKTDTQTVEQVRNQMRSERSFSVELLQYNRAGEELWVASKGEPMHDARRQLTHYVIRQFDLTAEHRRASDIDELAQAIAVQREIQSEPVTPADPVAQYPANDPALRLAQQLESLSTSDDRVQLQQLVDGMKIRLEDCVASLPLESIQSDRAA